MTMMSHMATVGTAGAGAGAGGMITSCGAGTLTIGAGRVIVGVGTTISGVIIGAGGGAWTTTGATSGSSPMTKLRYSEYGL